MRLSMLPVEPLERENKCRSLVQESCTRCKMSAHRWIRFQNFRACLCKLACTNSGCEVQEFCMQETRLWTPRAHEEEARPRFLRTHRHLHCGTKGVEKGSGRRLYSPGASLYKGLVQCTRSGRVRIDDCRIHARLCASHLQGNADLPGTWFKPHCAGRGRSPPRAGRGGACRRARAGGGLSRPPPAALAGAAAAAAAASGRLPLGRWGCQSASPPALAWRAGASGGAGTCSRACGGG